MALPATDAFTDTDGTALQSHGTSWTINAGAFAIASNTLFSNQGSTLCMAHWNADTFNNNQYSQLVRVSVASSFSGVWVAVRCHASANTGYVYECYASDFASILAKMVSGTETQIGSTGTGTAGAGDTMRLEANGTTITPKLNGSTTGTPGAQTDASIASGSAGVQGYSNTGNGPGDSWEGGNLGGGGAYTLTATQQSYTWTRNAANLLRGRKVIATQQSYTLTGQAVILAKGRKITAVQASFTLSGQAALFSRTRIMPAAQRSYTLAFQAANLLRGRKLIAAQQSYTLTFQAAGVKFGHRLAAAQQTYTLTFEAATLTYAPVGSRTLTAGLGSFGLTFEAAILLRGRKVIATQQSYPLTGQAASLKWAHKLAAVQQAYTLTREPANVLRGRLLAAAVRNLALTGEAAAFLIGRRLMVAQIAFVLIGVNANLISSVITGWIVNDSSSVPGSGTIGDAPAEDTWEVT